MLFNIELKNDRLISGTLVLFNSAYSTEMSIERYMYTVFDLQPSSKRAKAARFKGFYEEQ